MRDQDVWRRWLENYAGHPPISWEMEVVGGPYLYGGETQIVVRAHAPPRHGGVMWLESQWRPEYRDFCGRPSAVSIGQPGYVGMLVPWVSPRGLVLAGREEAMLAEEARMRALPEVRAAAAGMWFMPNPRRGSPEGGRGARRGGKGGKGGKDGRRA